MTTQPGALFTAALRLQPPCHLAKVELDTGKHWIDLEAERTERRSTSPACGAEHRPIHGRVRRRWRRLDLFHFEAWLRAEIPRVQCNGGGDKRKVVRPWVRATHGFILLFEVLSPSLYGQMGVPLCGYSVGRRVKARRAEPRTLWSMFAVRGSTRLASSAGTRTSQSCMTLTPRACCSRPLATTTPRCRALRRRSRPTGRSVGHRVGVHRRERSLRQSDRRVAALGTYQLRPPPPRSLPAQRCDEEGASPTAEQLCHRRPQRRRLSQQEGAAPAALDHAQRNPVSRNDGQFEPMHWLQRSNLKSTLARCLKQRLPPRVSESSGEQPREGRTRGDKEVAALGAPQPRGPLRATGHHTKRARRSHARHAQQAQQGIRRSDECPDRTAEGRRPMFPRAQSFFAMPYLRMSKLEHPTPRPQPRPATTAATVTYAKKSISRGNGSAPGRPSRLRTPRPYFSD